MSTPLKMQVGGNHYSKLAIQPAEYTTRNGLGHMAGDAIAYITRYKDKGGKQDLEKAIHSLELLIAMEYPEISESKPQSEDDGWIARTTNTSNWPDGVSADNLVVVKLRNGHKKTLVAKNVLWLDAGNGCDVVAWKFAQVVARKDDDCGWVPWDGGECPPHPLTKVRVKLRDGDIVPHIGGPYKAGSLDWSHKDSARDIIAYKLA